VDFIRDGFGNCARQARDDLRLLPWTIDGMDRARLGSGRTRVDTTIDYLVTAIRLIETDADSFASLCQGKHESHHGGSNQHAGAERPIS